MTPKSLQELSRAPYLQISLFFLLLGSLFGALWVISGSLGEAFSTNFRHFFHYLFYVFFGCVFGAFWAASGITLRSFWLTFSLFSDTFHEKMTFRNHKKTWGSIGIFGNGRVRRSTFMIFFSFLGWKICG